MVKNAEKEELTTISLTRKFRDELLSKGKKGETYEKIIKRLINEVKK